MKTSANDTTALQVLTVDVGNTLTRFGLFQGQNLLATWEVTTSSRMTSDEARLALTGFFGTLGTNAPNAQSCGSILSSVVPSLTDPWTVALRATCGRRPLVVGPGLKTGIKMHYKDPSEVGSDRVADLVAARERYGGPLVVVDLGTTTNFEVIDADGAFAGGLIAPGLALAARAVADAAARLPAIEVKAPSSVIGKSTREAMQAGVVMGEVARIDGLIDMIWRELGCKTRVVITGTDANTLCALLAHEATVDDTLILDGLRLIYEVNQRK